MKAKEIEVLRSTCWWAQLIIIGYLCFTLPVSKAVIFCVFLWLLTLESYVRLKASELRLKEAREELEAFYKKLQHMNKDTGDRS